MIDYRQAYEWGVERLRLADIVEAELDARLLLEYVCGTDRNTLLAHGDREVTAEEYDSYVNQIAKREKHIPLQHITGRQEFMGLEFLVNEHVLIPRQDTEILVEEALLHLHDGMRILDLCTGSGCILLSLLYYSNGCTGLGIDISEEALRVAGQNLDRLRRTKEEMNASFIKSDLFELFQDDRQPEGDSIEAYPQQFEMIVSNPPYIRRDVIKTLMPEVREHEPLLALDGKEDGLFFYRRIIGQADNYLAGGGELLLEIGYDQGETVKEMMEAAGYTEVEVIKDFAGLDRVVRGRMESVRKESKSYV